MTIADSSNLHVTALLLLILTAATTTTTVTSTSFSELETTIAALRSYNYNLFANAILTSDLLFELIHSNSTFTLFAPPDSALFALDMTASALLYIQTLRYHIVPRRVSASDLMLMRSGLYLPTLLPFREVRVGKRLWRSEVVVAVDDVFVVVPGLYYGDSVAVHGLAGLLNFRLQRIGARRGWSSVVEERNKTSSNRENQTFVPRIPAENVANGSMFNPIPRLPIPSSEISAPPTYMVYSGSPQLSPVAEGSSGELREALPVQMRKHSAAMLLEIEETTFDEVESESNLSQSSDDEAQMGNTAYEL